MCFFFTAYLLVFLYPICFANQYRGSINEAGLGMIQTSLPHFGPRIDLRRQKADRHIFFRNGEKGN